MGEPQHDLDNDLDVKPDPVNLGLLKLEERVFGGHIRLECYDIAPNDRIKDIINLHRVQFTIKLTEFQAKNGRTGFVEASQARLVHSRRFRSSVFAPAKIVATETLKGIKARTLVIDLYYHHAHELANLENIGTRQRVDMIKATIESLMSQGSSIRNVVERLTMKYARFIEVIRGNGQRLSRDDFITYEDVYNIWYNINNEMVRKDPDLGLLALAPQVDHRQQDLQQDLQEEEPVPGHGHSYYLDRINNLETLRDKSQAIPHESQLWALLDRFFTIYDPSLPRKEGEDLGNKRQRQ
ncbi:hypothetical protein BGX30_000190 [Mortierella sp. GBA39]|nr:hypothetical protein BGX30_000190 [Mortierella sp. GBA39]